MANNNAIDNRSEPLYVGNLKFDKNEISSTDTDGNINLEVDATHSCISVAEDTSGEVAVLNVRNSDNSNTSSSARLALLVNGDSNSNPCVVFYNEVNYWNLGCDNSEDDRFSLSASSGLGTNDVIRISTDGEVTMPLQSAFLAYNSSSDGSVTGNGTSATVDFDTEVFDQNSDFASDTFTAPVDGRYQLDATVYLYDLTNADACKIRIKTSNRNYEDCHCYGSAIGTGGSYNPINMTASTLADMDSGDTCTIEVYSSGEGSDSNGIGGSASILMSYFSGYLAT